MPLQKRFHSSIQHTGWSKVELNKQSDDVNEEPEKITRLLNTLSIMIWYPGKEDSAKVHTKRLMLPTDASEDYQATMLALGVQELIYDYPYTPGPKHVAFLTSKRKLVSTDEFPKDDAKE